MAGESGLLGSIDVEALRVEEEARASATREKEQEKAREISDSLDLLEKQGPEMYPDTFRAEILPKIYFERKLLAFALARGITVLEEPDWRIPALWFAAREHAQLQLDPLPKLPKKRGRKAQVSILFPNRLHPRAREEYLTVRKIMKRKGVTQAQACRMLALHNFGVEVTKNMQIDQVSSAAKQIENHIAQYKKAFSKSSPREARKSVTAIRGRKPAKTRRF